MIILKTKVSLCKYAVWCHYHSPTIVDYMNNLAAMINQRLVENYTVEWRVPFVATPELLELLDFFGMDYTTNEKE